MQETEQGLVALTAYSCNPASQQGARKEHVQLLAGCINKGDLSGLHSLQWEPPADLLSASQRRGPGSCPRVESIIHIPPLDPGMGMGHLERARATPVPHRPPERQSLWLGKKAGRQVHWAERDADSFRKVRGFMTMPPGPRLRPPGHHAESKDSNS